MTKTKEIPIPEDNKLIMKVNGIQKNGKEYKDNYTLDFRPNLLLTKDKIHFDVTGGLGSSYFFSFDLTPKKEVVGTYKPDSIGKVKIDFDQTPYELIMKEYDPEMFTVVIKEFSNESAKGYFYGYLIRTDEGGDWPERLNIEGAFNIKTGLKK